LAVYRQIQQELVDKILGLRPHEATEFSEAKAQLDILYEPFNRLRGMAQIDNQPEGGIL
jgi:hypothetical protein